MRSRELHLSRTQAVLYASLMRLESRLPAKVWGWFYGPISRCKREESLFERCQARSQELAWPATYLIDSDLGKRTQDITFYGAQTNFEPDVIKITDAVVFSDGIIIQGRHIHPASSCYFRISPHIRFRAAARRFSSGSAVKVPKATLVSRQLVDQGTYGDYFIEFLLPLCRMIDAVKGPVIADAALIAKYCVFDLESLGLHSIREIPDSGLLVKELTVIGPCQPFDNFHAINLAAVRKVFPIESSDATTKHDKIYISRLGFIEPTSIKQSRILENEAEVEEFLASKGFLILRPDGKNNRQLRTQLSSADMIVFNHGSGYLNAIWGKPRFVVELADEKWWNPAFLRLGRGMGVKKYHVICTKNNMISLPELERVLHRITE